MPDLTPQLLVRAYAMGIFPMARSRTDKTIQWIDPDPRGILPLDGFHIPRSLIKVLRRAPFDVRINSAFAQVMAGCAQAAPGRAETWINDHIIALFVQLHQRGLAHSVECWQNNCLVGGLYGLALGGAFFGESMFSRQTDASKVALVHLVALLRQQGYTLLDTQFVTDHLSGFGAIEIPRTRYRHMLQQAVDMEIRFAAKPADWRLAPPPL